LGVFYTVFGSIDIFRIQISEEEGCFSVGFLGMESGDISLDISGCDALIVLRDRRE
jgi:hypothetical protein